MAYEGNPSLAAPVKDRVTSTYQQTLALFKQGRRDEVAAGCNLILQMDPMFEPAKKLLEQARNPGLAIDVDALGGGDDGPSIAQAREAMAARDFQRVIHIATEILTNDLMNDDARILADEAREKLEAAPFIDQFVRKCDQSLQAGNLAAAKADLEKARSLDPSHPDVVRIERTIASRTMPSAAAPSSSFVVDDTTQQATGRATAPASDFGFTFEEEKPADTSSFSNFSFDTPASTDAGFGSFSFDTPAAATPAPAPAVDFSPPPGLPQAGGFDFSTASVSTSPDDQKKIEQYLTDGDRAFDAGDYQQAIDLWSRIFLIDVTNDQASDRIERAKSRRREIEQKIDTLLSSGITAMERGDAARARADIGEALRIDPNNVAAQEQMERLTQSVTEGGAAAAEEEYIPPPMDDKIDIGFFDDDPLSSDPSGGPLMPPDPMTAGAAIPKKTTGSIKVRPASPSRKAPVGLIVGVVALLALIAGGWFVWTRFMSKPEADPTVTDAILARASSLAGRGKFDDAIAALQEIQPDDPQHDKALVMIADLQAKKTKSAQMIDGIPIAQYYEQKIAAARTAFAAHDYVTAKAAFEDAQRARNPLPPDAKAEYDRAAEQVAKLDAAKALFTEQKYSEAIANLQPLLVEDPRNANVQRLIVDAHFNLGAKALQEERLQDAVKEFDEVLKVNPNDELAKRSRELAVRYDGEPKKDLLYQIYVKYLPMRRAA